MNYIDTDKASLSLREKAINVAEKTILITNFENSEQEKDLTEPPNCGGYGRVRHFRLGGGKDWPINPLPIYPALRALNLPERDIIRAQVFQNAVCNWRCWYCFVDFKLLSGNKKYSTHLNCETLLNYYQDQDNPPLVIDLTGGQPDLTPEWIPWMMEALTNRGLSEKVFLWSDDNLSNDYFWRYLSKDQIEQIKAYKLYGRVCCFKGIDELSFSYNTGASPDLYNQQFELWERLLKTGIDLYSYITLPAPSTTDFAAAIVKFMDQIQSIDETYLLRIVPLKIQEFTPVVSRMHDLETDLLVGQSKAIQVWQEQLSKRFSKDLLAKNISDIKTKYQNHE
jgi:organic radical activating enzyme